MTALKPDGAGRLDDDARLTFGSLRGAALRLGPVANSLLIAEGVETALSVMQETGRTTWAAGPCSFLANVILPDVVRYVTICADRDPPQRAA